MRVLSEAENEKRLLSLDKRDTKILEYLSANVRYPSQKIAEAVGLSRPSVDYRIRAMREQHLITGARTVINIRKLGFYSYHYFLTVSSEEAEQIILKRCMSHPLVNAVISYSGKWTFEISIMAPDAQSCNDTFQNLMEGVERAESGVCILLSTVKGAVLPGVMQSGLETRHVKNDPSFSRDFASQKIAGYVPDEKDYEILHLLADDAGKTLTEIGNKIGMTNDAVRYRVSKLIRAKYILQFRPAINYARMNLVIQTLLVKVTHRTKEKDSLFKELITRSENVLWCAETMGAWDYIVYVIGKEPQQIHDFISALKKGVSSYVDSYEVLFAYKEYKYSFLAAGVGK